MNSERKIKVAVQFFGHLRTFEICAQSVKQYLLDEYDCDVFIHTWNQTEHNTKTWHNDKGEITAVDATTIDKLVKLYNPKAIAIEEQDADLFDDVLIPCQYNSGKNLISSKGINFMIYSKNKVNQLRKRFQEENNVKYDYVVMIRPDIKLYKRFLLDEAIREIDFLKLNEGRYSAVNFGGCKFPLIGSNASDILYFANPETIDKILEVLTSLKVNSLGEKGFWNPETYFVVELQKKHIESYFVDYKYKEAWEIIRSKNKSKSFKDFLKIKINRKIFLMQVLGLLSIQIISFRYDFLRKFTVSIVVGKEVSDGLR